MDMKMTAKYPDAIEIRLDATMPLGDWKHIADKLDSSTPRSGIVNQFTADIREMVEKAERNFYPVEEG